MGKMITSLISFLSPTQPNHWHNKNNRSEQTATYAKYALACILVGFLLYATAVRDGHDWGGDYAQYILHAQTILENEPYTPPPGYIPNPTQSWAPAYPPLLPLALAAIMAFTGLNFIAFKLEIVLLFCIGFYAYWCMVRAEFPPKAALGILVFFILSPYLLKFSNKILSDLPYVTASFFTILAAERFFRPNSTLKEMGQLIIMLIVSISLRNIGLALIVAVPIYALLFGRARLIRALIVTGIAWFIFKFIASNMVGHVVAHADINPLRMVEWFLGNVYQSFPYQISRYLALYPKTNSPLALLNTLMMFLFGLLTIIGIIYKIRKHDIKYRDVYAVIYLCIILSYFWVVLRYLIPLMPLLSIYAFHGLRMTLIAIKKRFRLRIRQTYLFQKLYAYRFAFPALLYTPLFLAYWASYALLPTTAQANILNDPHVSELFEKVKTSNTSGAIFDRPRVLTLFTGVPGTVCSNKTAKYFGRDFTWDLPMLLDLSQTQNISHIILERTQSATRRAMFPIIQANPTHFRLEFSNPSFDIYHILK